MKYEPELRVDSLLRWRGILRHLKQPLGQTQARTMSIYLVTLNEDSADEWATLKTTWPGRYHILTNRIAFVAPQGLSLSEDIAETLGMNEEMDVTGLVIEWQSPSTGYNRKALWEWMKKIRSGAYE